jgi:hypothetical protein
MGPTLTLLQGHAKQSKAAPPNQQRKPISFQGKVVVM